MLAPGVVQPANRDEGMPETSGEHRLNTVQGRPDDRCGSAIQAWFGRCIAAIEKAPTLGAAPGHEIQVVGTVKQAQQLSRGRLTAAIGDRRPHPRERRVKHVVTVRPEGMPAAETIGGRGWIAYHQDLG